MALLVKLCLAEGPVERRALAQLLFGEAADPMAALRWQLAYLRRALPAGLAAALQIQRTTVSFDFTSDVQVLVAAAQQVSQRPSADAVQVLSLYRGDLCEGLTVNASLEFDTWLYVQQDEARRRFRQASLSFAQWARGAGKSDHVVGFLTRLLDVDPYCEDAHVALIEACEAGGRPQAAKAAFTRYQRLLREDLQAEPRPELAERYEGSVQGRPLPREGSFPLEKITLQVVDWPGNEPTIFAVHGSAGSGHSLAALAERLAPEFRFLAPDLRGHGFSDKPPSGYNIEQHAEDLQELMLSLGLQSPLVLGFSLGGAIATLLASRVPCRGLILLEGIVGTRAFVENAAAMFVGAFGDTLTSRGGFDAYLAAFLSTPASDEAERFLRRRAHFELAPLANGTFRRRSLRGALEESFASAAEADTLTALGKVRCPVLVVQAAEPWIGGQPYLTEDVISQQVRACPQAELFVAPNSTHAELIRDPEPGLLEAIRLFARRCAVSK
jgi:pimeloyl-ACP methyl ester carboxylesterase